MNLKKNLSLIAFAVMSLTSCQTATAKPGICKIYYVSFDVQTLGPISRKEIEDRCKRSHGLCFRMKSTPNIEILFHGISDRSKRAGEPYDFINVRSKIACEGFDFPVYIDSGKRVHDESFDYLVDTKLVDKAIREIEMAAKSCRSDLKEARKKNIKAVPCYLGE